MVIILHDNYVVWLYILMIRDSFYEYDQNFFRVRKENQITIALWKTFFNLSKNAREQIIFILRRIFRDTHLVCKLLWLTACTRRLDLTFHFKCTILK